MSEATNKKRVMALFRLRKRAESGTAEDWLELARVYAEGELDRPRPDLAREALLRAVAMGHAGARAALERLDAASPP